MAGIQQSKCHYTCDVMKIERIIHAIKRRALNFVHKRRSKTVSLEIAELFYQHNGEIDFMRYDMIVRLLAVENYFGKNDYGFAFYRRMQASRKNEEWVDPAEKRFRNLIKSYEEKGYDSNSKIILDKNLHLIDGSHRMAMAMYYGIPRISASIRRQAYNIFYGIEWFRINGFTDEECNILRSKYEELKAKYTTPFICSIWAPVYEYFDEITEKLRLFGEVIDIRDYNFNEWDYKFYTRGIYHVDDIEKWKIEKKIEYMLKSSPNCHKIRMVAINLKQPDFRLKDKTSTTLSKRCELIKKLIRDAYKDRVPHYFHDIIIHIGDNFFQNHHIYRLLTMPPINLTSILCHISERKYVVTKFDVPYMPDDFPVHYPLGKDIDIVCQDENEFKSVMDSILTDLKLYNDYYCMRIVNKGKNRKLVRLEQEGQYLVIQFDISKRPRTGSAVADFIDEMVLTRQKKDVFYIPQSEYEIILRLQELKEHPNKMHHKDYVLQHINDLDEQLCDKYLNFNWRKIIN